MIYLRFILFHLVESLQLIFTFFLFFFFSADIHASSQRRQVRDCTSLISLRQRSGCRLLCTKTGRRLRRARVLCRAAPGDAEPACVDIGSPRLQSFSVAGGAGTVVRDAGEAAWESAPVEW
jgi:hypothetical protein